MALGVIAFAGGRHPVEVAAGKGIRTIRHTGVIDVRCRTTTCKLCVVSGMTAYTAISQQVPERSTRNYIPTVLAIVHTMAVTARLPMYVSPDGMW